MTADVELTWACPECGAPSGEGCDEQCPSAVASYAVLVDEELEAAAADATCCVDVVAAAAAGCYCQGTAGRAAA